MYVTLHRVSLRVRRNYADIDDIACERNSISTSYVYFLFIFLLVTIELHKHAFVEI